jgi:hypothetical protein
MAYNGIAWPGVDRSISAITKARGVHVRTLKLAQEQPKLFKRPSSVQMKAKAAIADYDTALKVLRDAKKAAEAPPRKRRVKTLQTLENQAGNQTAS